MVKLIDDVFGSRLSILEEEELLGKTLVVFTSDHREYMGEHGLIYKSLLYESAFHVPLIIHLPDRVPTASAMIDWWPW